MKVILLHWEDNLPLLWYFGKVNSTNLWENQVFSGIFHTHTQRLVSLWGCPETSPITQAHYTSGCHHMAQGHTLLPSTQYTLQEATTQPRDIPYCTVHYIPFRRPPHSQRDHPTVPPAYPTFRSKAYPAMHEVIMRQQDCKSASQQRRALCPRDTVRHVSKKSAKQQSKGLYLARANKGSNGLGPSRPPCQLDGKIHALLHRTIFMEIHKTRVGGNMRKVFRNSGRKVGEMVKKRTIIDIVRWVLHKKFE